MFIFVISYKNIHNMKKLFYLLFYLIPFVSFAQISSGQEAEFDYGVRLLSPQTVTNPLYWGTLGSDGTMGRMPYYRPAQGDTGVLTFAGLATNSASTINIGAVTGWVQDNETNPASPTAVYVNYAGESNKTVTTVGSGIASYVMLSSAGVISFQNTFPTSAERKAKIWIGKVSHPGGSITLVVNEPDYITSPQALTRDLMQVLGYQNDGVYPYANGANLNINITSGNIHGNGINFVNDRTTPNEIHMGPATVQAFTYRSQTGVGGAVTAVTPGFYDVGGVVTAIPGSSNQATIQYFYAVPGIGYVAQLGQTLYSTFGAAVQALGNRTDIFVTYPSFIGNTIPIAALVVTKGCTALNDTGVTAQFFNANKNGDFYGATAGTSTATLQSTYNNSLVPQITTSTALGAVTVRRGSAADTDNVIVGQNGAGTITSSITGNGLLTANAGVNTQAVNNGGDLIVKTPAGLTRWSFFKNTTETGSDVGSDLVLSRHNDAGTYIANSFSVRRSDGRFDIGGRLLVNNATDVSSTDAIQINGNASLRSAVPNFIFRTTGGSFGNAAFVAGVNLPVAGIGDFMAYTVPTSKGHTFLRGTTNDFTINTTGRALFNTTTDNGVDQVQVNGSLSATSVTVSVNTITITTSVSITTATTGTNSLGQNNRHVILDNGVNAINLTCNGGVTTSYGKVGSGAITFVQGSGRTLVQLSGTAVLNGAVGSTATLWSNGTTDYLAITNY